MCAVHGACAGAVHEGARFLHARSQAVSLHLQVKDPSVDIPIGIVGATSIACVLYMALALVLCAMVPATQMDPAAPFASAFAMLAPAGGAWRGAFLHTSARFVSFGAFTGVRMNCLQVSSVPKTA